MHVMRPGGYGLNGKYYEVIDKATGTIVASGENCSEKEGYVSFDKRYYFSIDNSDLYYVKERVMTDKWASIPFRNPMKYDLATSVLIDESNFNIEDAMEGLKTIIEGFGLSAECEHTHIWKMNVHSTDSGRMMGFVNLIFTKFFGRFSIGPGKEAYDVKDNKRDYWVTLIPMATDLAKLDEDIRELADHLVEVTGIYACSPYETTYFNNVGKKSFQWELWFACNSRCKFCYLGTENRHTEKTRQLKSLADCQKAVQSLDFDLYNNISLIGGEFFQGQLDDPEVHDEFMKLIKTCFQYYAEKKIGSIWITVTLTLGDQHHLYEVLDLAEKMGVKPMEEYGASGLWLCTSWDAEGRFHTPEMEKNWDFHMRNIHTKYPWVKFNTTIILMQAFIDRYLAGTWSPKTFMKTYHTSLFYKQCGLGQVDEVDFDESTGRTVIESHRLAKQMVQKKFGFNFFPTRESFIKFLYKYATEDWETYDRLYNIIYRADELHRNFNDKDSDILNVRNKHSSNESNSAQDQRMNTCGHILNYAPYIDSDRCCICDRKMIWDTVRGGGL